MFGESVSHSWFGASAVKSRRTRSSWDGVPGLDPLPSLGFAEHRPPLVVPTDPPHDPVRHAGVVDVLADLVGEEPVAELGIIAMGVVDRIGQIGLGELAVGERAIEATGSRAGERDRVPDTTPRRGSRRRRARARAGTSAFWEVRLPQIRGRSAQHLVLLLEQTDPLLRLPQLGHLTTRFGLLAATAGVGEPVAETGLGDPEVLRRCRAIRTPSSRSSATRTTSSRNSLGYGLGMVHILSRHLSAPQIDVTRRRDADVGVAEAFLHDLVIARRRLARSTGRCAADPSGSGGARQRPSPGGS